MEAVGLCLAHGCSSGVNQLVSVSQTLTEKLEMGAEDGDGCRPLTALAFNARLLKNPPHLQSLCPD